jgi:hypothetical protein
MMMVRKFTPRIDLQIPGNFDVMVLIAIEKKDQRIICHNSFRKENILAIENRRNCNGRTV